MFGLTLLFAPYIASSQAPSIFALILIAATAYLFFFSAQEGQAANFKSWALSGIAALALFAMTLLAVILPSINKAWPARQIEQALAKCKARPIAVLGFREPTSYFNLSADRSLQSPEAIAANKPPVTIVEARWLDRYRAALAAAGQPVPRARGCSESYNVMRGCQLAFTIFVEAAGCDISAQFACKSPPQSPAPASPAKARTCD